MSDIKEISVGGTVYNVKDANAVTKQNISNCITEIPQDIKLELNNGTLTLKAGSSAYMPNGSGVFTKCTSTADKTYTPTWGAGYKCFVTGYVDSNNVLSGIGMCRSDLQFSGTTAPTATIQGTMWYDTSANKIKTWNGSEWVSDSTSWSRALFLGIVTVGTGNVITSIDQVFNGFGYIGSTVFALPGVKGLVPNGRDADGSLKSTELTRSSVLTTTYTTQTAKDVWFNLQANGIGGLTDGAYDEANNYLIKTTNGNKQPGFVFARADLNSGKIENWVPNTCFHSINYSDKNIIAGWGMPSTKYIDLTLGASGSNYTAPANGYMKVFLQFSTSANRVQAKLFGTDNGPAFSIRSYSAGYIGSFVPIKNGSIVTVEYEGTVSASILKFIYAEGENV